MSNARKIHVSELRTGMYVTKLDRDWLDTPFLMQGFLVEDREDIDIVAEFCEHVWVDDKPPPSYVRSSNVGMATSKNSPQYQNSADIYEEHKQVVGAFKAARSEAKLMLDNFRLGEAISTENAKKTVSHCVDSIIRHPDALLWMARIRSEREYTAEHCLNVCVLAIAFGRQLGMNEEELEKVGLCGLLHDVGKMRVPKHVLDKPGRLSDKEMRMMRAHTVHGRNLLMSTPGLFPGVIDAAYGHHERLDGTGYPRKISATGVSRLTRIITIVDAYDAMTADRVYDKARTSTEALKIIYNNRGTQFDEELAVEFIKTIGLYPAGCIVELYSGHVGVVIECNANYRHLPRLVLIRDENKQEVVTENSLDLSLIHSGDLPRKFLIKKEWVDGSFGISIREFQKKHLHGEMPKF